MNLQYDLESANLRSRTRILMRVVALAMIMLTAVLSVPRAEAQQAKKHPRACVLDPSPPSSPYFDGLKEGLTELGCVEG